MKSLINKCYKKIGKPSQDIMYIVGTFSMDASVQASSVQIHSFFWGQKRDMQLNIIYVQQK